MDLHFTRGGARPKLEVINFWKCSRSRTFRKDSLSQHFGSYLHKYISNLVKKKWETRYQENITKHFAATYPSVIRFTHNVEEIFSLGGAMKSPAARVTMCAKQNVFVLPNALF